MLQAMQLAAETRSLNDNPSSQEWESAPSPIPSSFAGMLAALATPAKKPVASVSPWENDELGDDVATLSYESALRTHGRYRATDQSLTQMPDPELYRVEEAALGATAAIKESAQSSATPEQNRFRHAYLERSLKDASITIRMSKAESAQLHRRAAEAGVTVSAYLRSCTFEAESLRAMVKETLAQLRAATAPAKSEQPRQFWLGGLGGWLARVLTPWQNNQRVARV
jgi:predicted DNA binding CopG/RHH family protein